MEVKLSKEEITQILDNHMDAEFQSAGLAQTKSDITVDDKGDVFYTANYGEETQRRAHPASNAAKMPSLDG